MKTLKIEPVGGPAYSIDKPASWISHSEIDESAALQHADSPYFYLLVDYQLWVKDLEVHRYCRTIEKINDSSRIEDASLFLRDINPDNEHYVLHAFDILRDGRRIDALRTENIEVYHRQQRLEAHIVDNNLTLAVTLDGLRAGDLLDISATMIEFATDHPLRAKQVCQTFWLSWDVPVSSEILRVRNDSGGALNLHYHRIDDNSMADSFDTLESGRESVREYRDLTSKSVPYTAPDWLCIDFVEVSSRMTWVQISRGLFRYYREAGALGATVDARRLNSVELSGDNRIDTLRLVRFVQNEIRYRGENRGVYTHTPKPPQRVLDKGAGDCKDKSNLLVALLASIGVGANLALVHCGQGKGLDRFEPSAWRFDHMIVRVVIDGVIRYFDPTVREQAGDFEHAAQLNFGFVLDLTETGEDLAKLPYDFSRLVFARDLRFDLRAVNRGVATLTITRRYYAHRADNMRRHLGCNTMQKTVDESLDWAEDETGLDLEVAEDFAVVADDRETNTLTTREVFRVSDLDAIDAPDAVPLANDFGFDFMLPGNNGFPVQIHADGAVEQSIEILYHADPRIEPSLRRVRNEHFEYRYKTWSEGRILYFQERLTPFRDQVMPRDISRYREAVEQMRGHRARRFPLDVTDLFPLRAHWIEAALLLAAGVCAVLSLRSFH